MAIFKIPLLWLIVISGLWADADDDLFTAANTNNIGLAKTALSQGANPYHNHGVHYCGKALGSLTILEIAVEKNNTEIAKLIVSEMLRQKNRVPEGWTFAHLLSMPLALAVSHNNVEAVNFLLSKKPDLGSVGECIEIEKNIETASLSGSGTEMVRARLHGVTPLMVAAAMGRSEMIDQLLARGADPNAVSERGHPVIFYPIEYNSAEGIIALSRSKKLKKPRPAYDNYHYPYRYALKKDSQEALRGLFEANYPVTANDLIAAAEFGNIPVLKQMLTRIKPDTQDRQSENYAIIQAAEKGQWEAVKVLVEAGSKPKKFPVLWLVMLADQQELFDYLLAKGADINLPNIRGETPLSIALEKNMTRFLPKIMAAKPKLTSADQHGRSILHYACESDNPQNAKMLLGYDINPNIEDKDGTTPLMLAAWKGHKEVVELLIQRKANVNARTRDHHGNAVYAAAKEGHLEVVKVLIAAGANVNFKAYDNSTAIQEAKSRNFDEIVQVLRAAGAKE